MAGPDNGGWPRNGSCSGRIPVEIVVKQGMCQKQAVSATIFKTWKERHIVLRRSRISWHEWAGERPLGTMALTASSNVTQNAEYPCSFAVQTGSKQLLVQCESNLEMKEWMVAIMGCINGLKSPNDPYYAEVTFDSKFEKGKLLGQGAFGDVFEARRISDGALFAVKVISRSKMLQAGYTVEEVDSIKFEASMVLRELSHPHIAKLEATFNDKNLLYLVVELCEGGDLYEKVKKGGAYSEEDARIVARRLLEAVAVLHKQDVVHRDLKLENIMLASASDATSCKIIDFGLARPPENSKVNMTCAGTDGNFAPEQLDRNLVGYFDKKCPEKVDVWQYGIVMYCLLSACHPFRSKNPLTQDKRIMAGKIAMTSKIWDNISDDAKDFVRSALTVNVESRPSAEQLLKHRWLSERNPTDVHVLGVKGAKC